MTDFHPSRRHVLIGALATGLFGGREAGATDGETKAWRRLTVGMSGFPQALEPILFNSTATRRVVPQMFDTLIAFDHAKGMTLRPALAERWERIDARSLRLALRKGVVFHDGSPFTADDVEFSFSPDHLLGPGRSGRTIAMQTLDRIDRVEIVDPYTIIIHAKGDDALLEQRLASWAAEIVSKRAFEAAGSWERWTAMPIGSGPYRLVSQKLDINVVLTAHEAYWGGRPPFSGVEFRIVPEVAARMNGLLTGELDIVTDIPPDQFATIQERPNLEVAGGAVQNIRYLGIDPETPGLTDPRARRALSLALDRKLFVETLWDNRVPVPNSFQFPSFGAGYIEDYPALAYDPDLARKLLKDAGYQGERITYRLLNNYYTNQVAGAQVMLDMWRAVGLKVEIEMMENFTQIYKKPVRAIYDSSSTAIFPDYLGHAWREFGPNGTLPKLVGIWRNEEHFALGAELQGTFDPEARRVLIRRMLEIIDRDDPPCVVLHASGQFYGKRRDVPWIPGQTLDLDFGPRNQAFSRS
ncbi:ABC transporter substrate-binding protein [Bradyrhizobium sp. LHD-71]|uniref:ABC transporter substrate-binding protein n=1 Tax=Bradyrhizobium sp. LHD-71 TaxID=3072141 RepID=UPI00280D0085|nr:ABC transporter substrate-binding protein [Bradyrhizobium sp. LHD-71]MDQ8731860.1 ABC transporter substrate-binding protein [Bradyrhizobium sp. LHD-71]